jgi:hypothetical protein
MWNTVLDTQGNTWGDDRFEEGEELLRDAGDRVSDGWGTIVGLVNQTNGMEGRPADAGERCYFGLGAEHSGGRKCSGEDPMLSDRIDER